MENITKGLTLRESKTNLSFENEEICKRVKEIFANNSFSFQTVSKKYVFNLINEFSGDKATVRNSILVSVLKEFVSSYYEKLTDIFNNCIRKDTFQETLRKAEVTLVFKKGDPTSKTYYRLVSTVSNYFQTLFKKPIYLKLNDYVQNKLPM